MTSLIEQTRTDDATSKAEAQRQYQQLLARNSEPRTGDKARLDQVLKTLSLTIEQFQHDVSSLNRLAQLQAQIIPTERLNDLTNQSAHASERRRTAREDWYTLDKKLERLENQTSLDMLSATRQNERIVAEIDQIKRGTSRVFGAMPSVQERDTTPRPARMIYSPEHLEQQKPPALEPREMYGTSNHQIPGIVTAL